MKKALKILIILMLIGSICTAISFFIFDYNNAKKFLNKYSNSFKTHKYEYDFTKDGEESKNYYDDDFSDYVNKKATDGVILAHIDGNVPNLGVNIPEATPYHLGYTFYFFEKACGVSGYLLGVNPFDQPGVEAYKKNMFALLGKPGYEEAGKELEKKLNEVK